MLIFKNLSCNKTYIFWLYSFIAFKYVQICVLTNTMGETENLCYSRKCSSAVPV